MTGGDVCVTGSGRRRVGVTSSANPATSYLSTDGHFALRDVLSPFDTAVAREKLLASPFGELHHVGAAGGGGGGGLNGKHLPLAPLSPGLLSRAASTLSSALSGSLSLSGLANSTSGSDSDCGAARTATAAVTATAEPARRGRAEAAAAAEHASACIGDAALASAWAVQRAEFSTLTADGVRLRLTRARCPAARAARPRARPVVLVPGLASSWVASFDITPELSILEHIARRGFEVWAVDLRGNGRSDAPRVGLFGAGWTVDDHLRLDVPAVIDFILRATGAPQLHWVGHSMGGMLAVGSLSLGGDVARAIASLTMVGSGCYGAGSWHAVLGPALRWLLPFGFPGVVAGHIMAPFVGTGLMGLVESIFYWRSNIETPVARALIRTCFRYIPRGLIGQFLGSMNTPGGLATLDGAMRYCDPKALASPAAPPVLGVNGDWDLFCPPPGGLRTVQAFGGPRRRFVFIGPAYGTSADHYGHFDIVMGRRAREEVWPHITGWLDECDAAVFAADAAAAAAAEADTSTASSESAGCASDSGDGASGDGESGDCDGDDAAAAAAAAAGPKDGGRPAAAAALAAAAKAAAAGAREAAVRAAAAAAEATAAEAVAAVALAAAQEGAMP